MNREQALANHICFWLLKWGAFVFIHDSMGVYDPTEKRFRSNQNPFRLKGVADIIGITGTADWIQCRIPLAVEVKVGKNKQSDDQKEFEKRWVAAGGVYVLAYSLLDVKTALVLPDTIEMPKLKVDSLDGQGKENRRS